jgi:hypothetical protein
MRAPAIAAAAISAIRNIGAKRRARKRELVSVVPVDSRPRSIPHLYAQERCNHGLRANYRNRRLVSMLTIKQAHPSTLRRLFLGREHDRGNEYKSQSIRRFVCLSNYSVWLSLATWPCTQQNHAAGDRRFRLQSYHSRMG